MFGCENFKFQKTKFQRFIAVAQSGTAHMNRITLHLLLSHNM